MTHTPAPWKITHTYTNKGSRCSWITPDLGRDDFSGWDGEHYLSVSGILSDEDEELIRSAPELLVRVRELEAERAELQRQLEQAQSFI